MRMGMGNDLDGNRTTPTAMGIIPIDDSNIREFRLLYSVNIRIG